MGPLCQSYKGQRCGAGALHVHALPWQVYLGEQYVNNATLSDVTFLVEGRRFHAHRIALLASSDTFRAMFDGHYREKEASQIPIPNIRFAVFESMMRCIYTGAPPARPGALLTLHAVLVSPHMKGLWWSLWRCHFKGVKDFTSRVFVDLGF